jgi:putative PIN family toxin of toxin-antitoxin system
MRSSRENEESSGKKPLTIFVDANTIVSGLVFEGNEALLLRLGRTGLCRLVTTRYVIDEVARVLQAGEFRFGEEEIVSLITYVNRCMTVCENVTPEKLRKYSSTLRDKKDVHVLAAFHDLKCDIMVTGDKELLVKVTRARTTRQALEILLSEK